MIKGQFWKRITPPVQARQASTANSFGIRLLPDPLREQIFPGREEVALDDTKLKQGLRELEKFNLNARKAKKSSAQNSIDHLNLQLPRLYGDVESHFYKIGSQYVEPYDSLLLNFLQPGTRLPAKPKTWVVSPGWTRYSSSSSTPESVPYPLEDAMCFDVETCVQDGPHPIIACAVTEKSWYGWCSPHLIQMSKPEKLSQSDLIPLDSSDNRSPRIAIGHNVSFDRARVGNEYEVTRTGLRFLDTMALHISTNGMTSQQRIIMQMVKKNAKEKNADFNPLESSTWVTDGNVGIPRWVSETSMNGLNAVYSLYCPGKSLDKNIRDTFVTGSLQDIKADIQNLFDYCAKDVSATYDVIQVLYPKFRERCTHPVSLAGMLEMGSAYLPISSRWDQYKQQSRDVAEELEHETHRLLGKQANESCQLLLGDKYKEDLWMWDQDWKQPGIRMKKPKRGVQLKQGCRDLREKFAPLLETCTTMYKIQPRRPGYPKWYQDHCSVDGKIVDMTSSKKIVPKLLRLKWLGFPLHYHETEKWGYIKLSEVQRGAKDDGNSLDLDDEDIVQFPTHKMPDFEHREFAASFNDIDDDEHFNIEALGCRFDFQGKPNQKKEETEAGKKKKMEFPLPAARGCLFVRLPHKDGSEFRVGNPLAKDFLDKVKDGILSTDSGSLAAKVLEDGKALSYWKSNKARISEQMVVTCSAGNDVILPQMVTAGTLTRRAVEKTWLTASNAKPNRIGSELKTLVEAPSGYCLVGADVDSQELWIAAVLGDAAFSKQHGSTPLGWMTLQGSKSEGTDMHSVTAKTVGVSRDNAKVLNYGRIYGAGIAFARQLLQKFNPLLSESEAKLLAKKMYAQTKGERSYVLNKVGANCLALWNYSKNGSQAEISQNYVGRKVDKRVISQVIKMKELLDLLLAEKEDGTWTFKDGIILPDSLDFIGDEILSREEMFDVVKEAKKLPNRKAFEPFNIDVWKAKIGGVTSSVVWHGGSESHTFNRLESIGMSWQAATPVLGCKISQVLESKLVGTDYLPSRVNWVVQSSAVDYLHLLLVAMSWIMTSFGIEGRFVISIHDEVRYLVKEEQRYHAALALQISNLLVRCMFCSRLGMANLPQDVAFFSGVDIDKVMRKEPDSECITPSNPQGLSDGCNIPLGESLNIQQIVNLVGNSLAKMPSR